MELRKMILHRTRVCSNTVACCVLCQGKLTSNLPLEHCWEDYMAQQLNSMIDNARLSCIAFQQDVANLMKKNTEKAGIILHPSFMAGLECIGAIESTLCLINWEDSLTKYTLRHLCQVLATLHQSIGTLKPACTLPPSVDVAQQYASQLVRAIENCQENLSVAWSLLRQGATSSSSHENDPLLSPTTPSPSSSSTQLLRWMIPSVVGLSLGGIVGGPLGAAFGAKIGMMAGGVGGISAAGATYQWRRSHATSSLEENEKENEQEDAAGDEEEEEGKAIVSE